jgi:hypothetical protein
MGNVTPGIEQAEAELAECIARAKAWDASCDQAASRLARVLVESGMSKGEMIHRFRRLGLSGSAARGLVSSTRHAIRGRERAEEEAQFVDATPLCPHCLHPIDPLAHLCPNCFGPVSAHAAIDPIKRIYTMGWGYRNAVFGKPRLVTIVGMWLILAPFVVFGFLALYLRLRDLGVWGSRSPWISSHSDGLFYGLLRLAFVVVPTALFAAILIKATSRWRKRRRAES